MIENEISSNRFQFLDQQISQFPNGQGPFTDIQIQQSRELIYINSTTTEQFLKHLDPNLVLRNPPQQRLADLRAASNAAPNNIVTPFRTICSSGIVQFTDVQRNRALNVISLNVITRRSVIKVESDRLALLAFPEIDATLTPALQVTAIKTALSATLLTTAEDQWTRSELAFATNNKTNDETNAQI
jgi:hypothetical protein